MNWWQKLLVGLGVITLLGVISLFVYKEFQISTMKKQIEMTEISNKQLQNQVDRASNQYITKEDLNKFAEANKINLNEIRADLANMGGDIRGINITIANSKNQNIVDTGGKIVYVSVPPTIPLCPSTNQAIDVNGWYSKQNTLPLTEKFIGKDKDGKNIEVELPIGSTTFTAQNKPGSEWDAQIYGRKYTQTTVITETENRERIITYNMFDVDVNGKSYRLPVTSNMKEIYPLSEFKFNPRLYLGLSSGAFINENGVFAEVNPNLSVSLLSYGKFKTSPEWSIAAIGIGYGLIQKSEVISLTPVAYNLHGILPFLRNTYVELNLNYTLTNRSVGAMIGLKVEL